MNKNEIGGGKVCAKKLSIFAAVLFCIGAGCTSQPAVDSNWIRRVNENFEAKDGTLTHDSDSDMKLARLWSDKPENVALLRRVHFRNVRVVSGIVPQCPPTAIVGTHFPVRVQVSFLVGIDGKVKDARIYESYDSRFDPISLETIRKFKFVPARNSEGRPELQMTTLPFVFLNPRPGVG